MAEVCRCWVRPEGFITCVCVKPLGVPVSMGRMGKCVKAGRSRGSHGPGGGCTGESSPRGGDAQKLHSGTPEAMSAQTPLPGATARMRGNGKQKGRWLRSRLELEHWTH